MIRTSRIRSATIDGDSTVPGIGRRSPILVAALLPLVAACASAEIPYTLSHVATPAAPVHEVKVAVLPLADDRLAGDGPDTDRFTYRGVEYEATDLSDLEGEASHRITEMVARHLAKAGLFTQVILVLDPSQAPEADLLLTGRIYRMRGYVEVEPEDDARRERHVLSEVVLQGLTLRDAADPERVLLESDTGWSTFDRRAVEEAGPTPWDVLGETLFVALDKFAQIVAGADLSGALDVRRKVALNLPATASTATFGELGSSPPHGWGFSQTSTAAQPIGWKGRSDCEEARFEQKQTLRFHRVLGPYRPTVLVWACPVEAEFTYDDHEEFPSLFLGERNGRIRYFGWALGETNWPEALHQIARHLQVVPPSQRYLFELPARTATSSVAVSP